MPSLHRLRHGLPGYLIPFTSHAVVPERQDKASKLPSQLVFPVISTHFTAPRRVPLTSPCLKNSSIQCSLSVEPIGFNTRLATPPADPLRPIIPANAWGLCITAPAGTELGAPFLYGTVKVLPIRQQFTTRRPSSCTQYRSVTLSCIAEDSRLQPPVGVWTVSQFQCWGSCSHIPYPS